MSRISGRRGRVYLSATNGSAAIPVTAQAQWNLQFTQSELDVTAMGDSNKTYVVDIPDAGGSFSGFHDDVDTGTQIFAAATDGLSRNLYIYPDATVTKYFYGTCVVTDYTADGGVGTPVTANVTFKAAGPINFKSS